MRASEAERERNAKITRQMARDVLFVYVNVRRHTPTSRCPTSMSSIHDAVLLYSKVAEARPELVHPSRWENWQLWKQSADRAEVCLLTRRAHSV